MRRAASLAAEIKDETGHEAVLEKGSGGVFDVFVDGKLIFSKHERGRFPDAHEIIEQIPST